MDEYKEEQELESTLEIDRPDTSFDSNEAGEDIQREHDAPASQFGAESATLLHDEVGVSRGSWLYYALVLALLIIASDYVVAGVGRELFWSPRVVYVTSFVARLILLLIAAGFVYRRVFEEKTMNMYVVFMWTGAIAGLILAMIRFVNELSFWTLLNIIVEPLDTIILAAFSVYVITQLIRGQKLTKQTV